jgi:hypothetical protein
MAATEQSLQDLSRVIMKMSEKHDRKKSAEVIMKLFEIASTKMKKEESKEVLKGL